MATRELVNPEKRPRGRPRGRTSRWKSPVNIVANDLEVTMEWWLGHQSVRTFTVPGKIKRFLFDRIIERRLELDPSFKAPDVDDVLKVVNRRAPGITLRRKAKLRTAKLPK